MADNRIDLPQGTLDLLTSNAKRKEAPGEN
jgi:hypothetical protein